MIARFNLVRDPVRLLGMVAGLQIVVWTLVLVVSYITPAIHVTN